VFVKPRHRWLIPVALLVLTVVCLPGWTGELELVEHSVILREARDADRLTPTTLDAGDGAEWHLTHLDSTAGQILVDVGLGGLTPRLVPPEFAAYVPRREGPADAYYRVEATVHWPWWWPGGGLSLPR